jgi:hypothetical protein
MKNLSLGSVLFVTGVLIILPVVVYADNANEAQRLASLKQIKQQGLDGRLNVLQQERACVQAAATMEALHACGQASHQMMEKMHEQQKASWESLKASHHQDKENKK